MNKLRLLTIFSLLMLLVNIFLIGFILYKKEGKQKGGKRNPVEIFSRELGFNNAQKNKLKKLVEGHLAYMDAVKLKVEPIKKELRQEILANNQSAEKDSLFIQLGNIQADVERNFHQHFIDIKNLCEEEQIVKFEHLLENMPHGDRPQGPPPHKKH